MAKENKNKEMNRNEIKRLYRSKEDRMIAGVSGGIAEYLNVDPVWVRLAFVILLFFNGVGLLIYIILWILVPENPNQISKEKTNKHQEEKINNAKYQEEKIEHKHSKHHNDDGRGRYIVGSFLIIIGLIFLLKQYFVWINFGNLWPVFLIGFGLILLFRRHD